MHDLASHSDPIDATAPPPTARPRHPSDPTVITSPATIAALDGVRGVMVMHLSHGVENWPVPMDGDSSTYESREFIRASVALAMAHGEQIITHVGPARHVTIRASAQNNWGIAVVSVSAHPVNKSLKRSMRCCLRNLAEGRVTL